MISLFKKLFRSRRQSRLTDALNNDIALKDSLVQEFHKPWVTRGQGGFMISSEGIEIVADEYNSCVRIKTPRETFNKETLLDVLPSDELMQSLDRIAYHVRTEIVNLESSSSHKT